MDPLYIGVGGCVGVGGGGYFCTLFHSSVGVGGGGGQFKARVEGNYMCSPPPGSDSWRFAQVFLQNYFLPNLHSKRASLSFTLDEN